MTMKRKTIRKRRYKYLLISSSCFGMAGLIIAIVTGWTGIGLVIGGGIAILCLPISLYALYKFIKSGGWSKWL